jgi:hypothetical protein
LQTKSNKVGLDEMVMSPLNFNSSFEVHLKGKEIAIAHKHLITSSSEIP